MFCYQARKFIGALSASMNGINCLVFTGGIGENSSTIRARICKKLNFLGIEIDTDRNNCHKGIISTKKSAISVRVIKTNEEYMIAKHTYHMNLKPNNKF
jgi:acetate kinase